MARDLSAKTDDGSAQGVAIVPEGPGPFPLVLYFPDAGGVREATLAMGDRLAAAGYAVIEVDPFWRQRPFRPFDLITVWTDRTERTRLFSLIAAVEPARFLADARALVAALDDPRVRTTRFGVVGYCMGGRLGFLAAAEMPDRVVAVAAIHAGGLVSDAPDSPHHQAHHIRAALYLGVADEDPSCTPAQQAALRNALDAGHVRYQLEFNPGARHGYAMSDFAVYDRQAAERHWQRVLALFAAHLRGAA